jgi:CDP-glucose 4,6-dehydratase
LRSDGTFVRDYLHVDDIVSAYLLLGENSHKPEFAGEGFNFSDETPLTVMNIYEAICAAAGKQGLSPKVLNSAVGEIKDQYLDSTKAHNVLGWKAQVSLAEGLSKTFTWYQSLLGGQS